MASNRVAEIRQHLVTLGENKNHWTKELNVVQWNGRDPKYDIREWSEDHEKMGKGVTFTQEEFDNLQKGIKDNEIKLGDFFE